MTITAAIVLFAVIWFMVLFICLPLKVKTQGDSGNIVPGTPESAPENGDLKNKLNIEADFVSKSAEDKLNKIGCSISIKKISNE